MPIIEKERAFCAGRGDAAEFAAVANFDELAHEERLGIRLVRSFNHRAAESVAVFHLVQAFELDVGECHAGFHCADGGHQERTAVPPQLELERAFFR